MVDEWVPTRHDQGSAGSRRGRADDALGQVDALASGVARALRRDYPELTTADLAVVLDQARAALHLFGLAGAEDMTWLFATVAERQARLRLGLDPEEARLDPRSRRPRTATDP